MSQGSPKSEKSEASKIVGDLRGPLTGRLSGILQPAAEDPFFQRTLEKGVQKVRGGYGARGLAGSGISLQGEQDFIGDATLGRDEQKANQAIQILGAGSGAPTFAPAQAPRGLFGLK